MTHTGERKWSMGSEPRHLRGRTGSRLMVVHRWMTLLAITVVMAQVVIDVQAQDLAAQDPGTASDVARGAYLARLGDCAACHSVPGAPDFSGGLPLHSPLGTIYSTNITPDRETGIGNYSLQDFASALRAGKSPRHHLYPAMPYPSFAKLSNDDVAALYAYFVHGVAPVHRTPARTELHFPFDQRWGLALWNWAFLDHDAYRSDSERSARWNRGAYLVQGLGHCGACHTPRGVAYQEQGYSQASHSYLAGGVTDHWLAPSLRGQRRSGLGNWSEDDLVQFLKTGHGARAMAFGPMKQVVVDSMQHVDDADLISIATYLKSLSPERPNDSLVAGSQQDRTVEWLASGDIHVPGGGLFNNFCAKCHRADGRGDPLKAPALAGSAVVRAHDPSSVIHIILSGGKPHQPPGTAAIDPMPAFAAQFNDREVAQVASFIRHAWGNDAAPVTARRVQRERSAIAAEKP